MGTAFRSSGSGSFPIITVQAWGDLRHGFGGRAAGGGDENALLREALGVEAVLRVKQVHGREVLDLEQLVERNARGAPPEADAIVFSHTGCFAAAIATADCVPLIIRSANRVALVHAGWRGLAQGVIGAALSVLGGARTAEAAIGPCACGGCYEVGPEVVAALGAAACVRPGRAGRSLLDLAGTAAAQLRAAGVSSASIYTSGICTIEELCFHSYRRDGEAAGRNLTFVALS